MLVLRYLQVLALAIWVGSMVAIGALMAPTTFQVLQARLPGGEGRTLAGALFGEVLRRFNPVAYGCGLIILLTLFAMKVLGPRPVGFGIRVAIASVMLALSLYSGIWVSSRIERMQADIGVSVASLPDTDPRKAEFGRLHGLSTTLMMINLVGGIVLFYWHARD